jgi:hypothetical protein
MIKSKGIAENVTQGPLIVLAKSLSITIAGKTIGHLEAGPP